MIDIKNISKSILLHGTEIQDVNLNRNVKELINEDVTITSPVMGWLIDNVKLNKKYDDELNDVQKWYDEHFPLYNTPEYRRRIVYFNNEDYEHRFQCISLFQIIDDVMIIYQRSSDIEKMEDDLRFFVEIKNRHFPSVDIIHIHYGSLHIKIDNDD